MLRTEARNLINTLQEDKGRSYGDQAIKLMWPAFESVTYRAGEIAFDYLILNFTTLPTANAVIDQLQKAQHGLNMAAAKQREDEDREERKNTPRLSQVQPTSELGRDAIRAMKRLFNGITTKEEYLKECGQIALKYRLEDTAKWVAGELAGHAS